MNPYKVLGVSTDSPQFVIQAAYRACLKRYHPDHYKGADASKKTSEVLEAYRVIGDPAARAKFDADQNSNTSPPQSPPPPGPTSTRAPAGPAAKIQDNVDRSRQKAFAAIAAMIGIVAITWGLNQTLLNQKLEADAEAAAADNVEMPLEEAMPADAATAPVDAMAPGQEVTALDDATIQASTTLQGPQEAVEFRTVERAAIQFYSTLKRKGMGGARSTSERCHEQQKIAPTWEGLDYCAAFDFAAAEMDKQMAPRLDIPTNSYFEFQAANQKDYYGSWVYTASSRLGSIRRAADSALLDVVVASLPRGKTETSPAPQARSGTQNEGQADIEKAIGTLPPPDGN